MKWTSHSLGLLVVLTTLAGHTFPAHGQEETKEPSLLTVTNVTVTPEKPGADTLCQLRVQLKNEGEEIASQLGFAVEINGQDLAVYGNQLFMFPVPAKGEAELQLFNFWTTETSRPMPADGKLKVQVELREAQWMSVRMEREEGEEEEIETWRPLGAVDGLPVAAGVTLEMSKGKGS